MSNKKKRSVFKVLSRVHWKSFIILILFALYMSPIFSTPELDKSELKSVETTIANVEYHDATYKAKLRMYWITFSTSEGKQFYYRPTGEGKKVQVTKSAVELLESYSGKKVTIFYTEQRTLSIGSLLFFSGYERVAAIECGQDIIFSLDEFNQHSRTGRITSSIISAVVLIIALAIFFTPIIVELVSRNKKRKKRELKKMKKQHHTGDG